MKFIKMASIIIIYDHNLTTKISIFITFLLRYKVLSLFYNEEEEEEKSFIIQK